jgi:PAT family acetyl-CoA transporter-like MFS transporter 1
MVYKQHSETYNRFSSMILTSLYGLQGLVIGLFLASMELKLKQHFSYSEIGVFLMCSYPFSLKLLWSPIVDSIHSSFIGVKKSWIIPMQYIAGFLLIFLSYSINDLIHNREIIKLSILAFIIMFMIATQDIAVDSWGMTISKDVLYYIIIESLLSFIL